MLEIHSFSEVHNIFRARGFSRPSLAGGAIRSFAGAIPATANIIFETVIKMYTDKEIKEILSSITILVDTREQENSHVLAYLKNQNITHTFKKLDFGDYSYMALINGVPTMFDDKFAIERKASLTELSGNFTQGRSRFENEFIRGIDAKMTLLIEDACYLDILNHKYRTNMNAKAFLASLLSFRDRYNLQVDFCPKSLSGMLIHLTCYYHLRNYLML